MDVVSNENVNRGEDRGENCWVIVLRVMRTITQSGVLLIYNIHTGYLVSKQAMAR